MPGAKSLLKAFFISPYFGVPFMQTICKKWQQALVCLVSVFFSLTLNANDNFSDYLDLEHCRWYQNPQLFHQPHLAQFRKTLGEREDPPSDEDQITASLHLYCSLFFQNHSSLIRTDTPLGLPKDKRIYPTVLDDQEKNFIKPVLEPSDKTPNTVSMIKNFLEPV
jgi:hypothetical protein